MSQIQLLREIIGLAENNNIKIQINLNKDLWQNRAVDFPNVPNTYAEWGPNQPLKWSSVFCPDLPNPGIGRLYVYSASASRLTQGIVTNALSAPPQGLGFSNGEGDLGINLPLLLSPVNINKTPLPNGEFVHQNGNRSFTSILRLANPTYNRWDIRIPSLPVKCTTSLFIVFKLPYVHISIIPGKSTHTMFHAILSFSFIGGRTSDNFFSSMFHLC